MQRNILVPTITPKSLAQLGKTAYKYRVVYSNFKDVKKGGEIPDPLVHIGHKFTKIYSYQRDENGALKSTKGAYYNNKKGGIVPPPVTSQGVVTTFKRLENGLLVKGIRVATNAEAKKAQAEKAAVAKTEKTKEVAGFPKVIKTEKTNKNNGIEVKKWIQSSTGEVKTTVEL